MTQPLNGLVLTSSDESHDAVLTVVGLIDGLVDVDGATGVCTVVGVTSAGVVPLGICECVAVVADVGALVLAEVAGAALVVDVALVSLGPHAERAKTAATETAMKRYRLEAVTIVRLLLS